MIVQLKENQKELLSNCKDLVRFTKPLQQHEQTNAERNRLEKRVLTAYAIDKDFIEDAQWREAINTIYKVQRLVEKFSTKKKQYEVSEEVSYYISNKPLPANQAFELIQNHWRIENSNNYVRDVSMMEDFSRIRIKPEIMAKLRSFALNIMRKNQVSNIKGEMYQNSLCISSLYSYQHFL